MEEEKIAPAGSFCWNEECPDYGQVGKGHIRKSGRTDKGRQRYQCKMCKKTRTETKGTMFYRCRHSEQTIVECLAMLGDRNSLAAVHRVKGVKEETVGQWLERAATHVEQIEERLSGSCQLSRVQLDALWTYGGTPLMGSHQPWPPMAKGAIAKPCSRHGDKCQPTAGEAGLPACPSRAKTGSKGGPDPSHPQWLPRTPAQAAGLTDHIWTVKELLTTVLVPLAINT